uniref:Temptin Cys/Cys disulfide domain-containing protein n=1 Tax=Globisporangium ultimum (strain ATCC 200006 / CBS 805.95 / DAOM BR144) TaxID=431595 RepID=K3X0X4_GLOUD
MKLIATTSFLLSACVSTIAVLFMQHQSAFAYSTFRAKIPNGYNVTVKGAGHVNPYGGGVRNAFRLAFKTAGLEWTVAFCQADFDGDGQTNGQELGDPCCEFTAANKKALWNLGVSNPVDATKTSDQKLWNALNCTVYPTVTNTTTSSAVETRSSVRSVFVLILLYVLVAIFRTR